MEIALGESYWPADRSTPLLETTATGLLRDATAHAPERTALIALDAAGEEAQSWTYAELLCTTERVAQALLTRFAPGERVAIWAPNRPEWLLLHHGLSLAGMIMVTVNPAYRGDELAYVLRQSRAAGVFHASEYRGCDMGATVAGIRRGLPTLRESICLDEFEAFLAGADDRPRSRLPDIRPGTPALIQYTSGTTGFPKGALLHHRGVVNASAAVARRAGFSEGGVWVNAMPMFHIGGVGQTALGTLSQRGTYVLLAEFNAGVLLRALETYRATVALAVPTMLLMLLEHPDLPTRDLTSLQTLYSGATAVPAALVERVKTAFGCRFGITFGQTELHGTIAQTHVGDPPVLQAETVGQPVPQMEVKIADPASGQILPLGEVGEICARGPQTMIEYFEMPEQTSLALRPDGWLHTGDLGTLDEHGYLRVCGRLKDTIIRGGENISAREIEECLLLHPAVAEAAVVGAPDERWGERVIAVVRVIDPQAAPEPDELHDHCRESLARYKTPVGWCFVEALPTTATGKVQKFVIRESLERGELVPRAVRARASSA
jgi:fatty-acyl-CoA synthase